MAEPTGDPGLGARIREARKRAGLTQQTLLDRLPSAPAERDYHWVSNVETGYRMPAVRDIVEIADALGVTTDELLRGPRKPATDEELLLFALRHAPSIARKTLLASARAIAEETAEYDAAPPSVGETSA